MIKYIQGDLFGTLSDIIAHGCNCRGVMGSGVAYIVRTKYPKAYEAYLDKYDEEGWKLGEVQFVPVVGGQIIANCATQKDFMPRTIRHANYPAIVHAMTTVKEYAKERGLSIAIPRIGAGLAGGEWSVIEKDLEAIFSDYDITVYYLPTARLSVT